jgi:HK97 family phage portal protein
MAMRLWPSKRRREEERTLTSSSLPDVMLRQTASGVTVTPGNALAIVADAFACVRVLADSAASLPLITYRRLADGGRARVEQGRLPALLDRPAPQTRQCDLIGQMVAHLNLWGNAYLGLFREAGEIAQLALLAPERMQVRLEEGVVRYDYVDDRGRTTRLTERDLIHVKGLSVDGIKGLSPVTMAREALGLSAALSEHAARFFENDASARGILKLGQATPERLQELTDAWHARHQGVSKAHRIAVVTGDVDYTQIGMSPEDAQLLQSRQWSSAEVARIFRVPPSLIGAPTGDSLTYGNRESDAMQFVTFSLRPWLTAIEQAISANEELCPPGSGTYCEFLLDSLLRADSATRAQVYTAALDPITGWMAREEVRKLENLPAEQRPPAGQDGRDGSVTLARDGAGRPPLEPARNGGSNG